MNATVPFGRVAVIHRPGLRHPTRPPFDPPNEVDDALAALLAALGNLDDLVRPGDRVLVKPNLVSAKNLHQRIAGKALEASSTHGSLLRAVVERALAATGPEGEVVIADCPVEGCEIDRVLGPLGITAVVEALRARGAPVRFLDLRPFWMQPHLVLDDVRRAGRSFNLGILRRRALPGDPMGRVVVDLAERSFFARPDAPPGHALRFHRSHYRTPVPHHTAGKHAYSIGRTVLTADVVITLAKLKTHKKTGVTLALKSAIGLASEKYWLPHFTEGDPSRGGDELDRPQRLGERIDRKLSRLPLPGGHSLIARAPRLGAGPRVLDGSWEGNDTLWRTILDLNRILWFADEDGTMRAEPQRRHLAIVDGIVAGEGEGPLGATPVDAGLLIGGRHPALVDWVAAQTMGFDPASIPTVAQALESRLVPGATLEDLDVRWDGPPFEHRFRPPRSWPRLRPRGDRRGAA